MNGRAGVLLRWLPALAWMVVIFALSSVSGLRVSDEVAVDRPFRTLAHLGSYALLASLLLYAIAGPARPRASHALVAFGLTVLYGVTDEMHQAFVPDRTGRIDDVVTDAVGAAAGVALSWLLLTWLASRRAAGPRP